MIFFTADNHFFHENVIKFCNRPFKNLDEMHAAMINRWNSVVKKEDQVYVVGDFIWPKIGTNMALNLLRGLNGEIHLISGDHDMWGIEKISNVHLHYREVFDLNIGERNSIILCHWPMRNWPKSHFNSIHLFGHVHNNNKEDVFYTYGKSFNIGVDVWDFTPVSLQQVLDKAKTLGDNHNFIKSASKRP